MLRNIIQSPTTLRASYILSHMAKCNSSTAAVPPVVGKEKWDLYAGVIVERLPIISKSLNPIEREFQEYLWRIEYENSLKSDFEMRHEREQRQAQQINKSKADQTLDIEDAATKQTAQDLKDAYIEELKQFKFASRETPDDKTNKLTSTNRCLEETLYLIVQTKLGEKSHFLLPQGKWQNGETLRQTAERVLHDYFGGSGNNNESNSSIDVQFYGNAPIGFYKYKYPSLARQVAIGAKVFFYRATLTKENLETNVKVREGLKFEWLTKLALNEKLNNDNYSSTIQKFLF